MPCCDDPDLRQLLRRRPIGVKPTVPTLMRVDHRAAAMVGARTIWRIQEWIHAHPDGPGLLVVHPAALHLAVWSLTNFVLQDPPSEPHVFKLEIGVTQRTVTFPPGTRVAPLPYPV